MNFQAVELWISQGKRVLEQECNAIERAAAKLDLVFAKACEIIMSCKGKVVVTGLGKSGHIARKLASTLTSTGTPSMFLHPTEALHGDFGVIQPADVVLAIAQGGETREVLAVVNYAKVEKISSIAITGKLNSSLSKAANVTLFSCVENEADGLGLAPTSSSTLALALGDALAISIMHAKNFKRENFAKLHPGGSIGRSLVRVEEIMRNLNEIKTVKTSTLFRDVIDSMSSPNYGIIAVVDEKMKVVGAVTDGDIRRALIKSGTEIFSRKVETFMNDNPKLITKGSSAMDAINLMETLKITSLFAVDSEKLIGLVRLQDCFAAHIV